MKSFGKVCPKHPELNGERYQRNCVSCKKERGSTYASQNWRKYWERDKAAWALNSATWRSKNKDHIARVNSAWERNNRAHRNMRLATRRALQQNATPRWADLSAVKAVYAEADRMTRQTGIKHNVDHIVPLHSNVVCGLHVSQNLRVVTQTENYKKGNRWWPDMPEEHHGTR